MPEAVAMPQKRVLGDATNNPRSVLNTPGTVKKRKLDAQPSATVNSLSQNGLRKTFGSSQPQKSQFEEEVLEKLTQDINGLKNSNSEKDQQWERPPLGDFDETKDNICFQQIDAEEGTITGGKTAVRLFGVTEVDLFSHSQSTWFANGFDAGRAISFAPRHRVSTLPIYRGAGELHQGRLRSLSCLSREQTRTVSTSHSVGSNNNEREHLWISRKPEELLSEDHSHGTEVHQQGPRCAGEQCARLELQGLVE
jgi:hypothetical protein